MADKRNPQDEKLIRDLYEKLNWFTFQASEEEFDAQQVRAILTLLDTLDPMPEVQIKRSSDEEKFDKASDPEAAFERFKERYNIAQEDLSAKDNGSGDAALVEHAGKICRFPAECSEELSPDDGEIRKRFESAGDVENTEASFGEADGASNAVSDRTGKKRKKNRRSASHIVGKAAAAVLVVAATTTFLSIGTSAVTQKSFFEIVRDGVNSMKITVTGNEMESVDESAPALELNEENKKYFSSWNEVKKDNPDILSPSYIPEGMSLETLSVQDNVDFILYDAKYTDKKDKTLRIWIEYYKENFAQIGVNDLKGGKLIKAEKGIEYYKINNEYRAIWSSQKGIYTVTWKNLQELEKIVKEIK